LFPPFFLEWPGLAVDVEAQVINSTDAPLDIHPK